jgi:nucleoside-diphosphate-sugar epimerase
MTIRVLLTGASSFTGSWFAGALAERGAEVVAPCRDALDAGDLDRRRRLARLAGRCRLVGGCPFGSEPFLEVIRSNGPFDLLCHHGAKAGDHRDAGLDPLMAAARQSHGIERVLDALAAGDRCRAVLLTGTVFEADEGGGDPPLRAIGAYGLAKTLTWQIFRHHAEARGLALSKFVIANPIGPLEKPGLCRSLARAWLAGGTPELRRPHLVRDQLMVEPLAEAYADVALRLAAAPEGLKVTPSQFAERLDRFAHRLAAALGPRLGVPCRFVCAEPPEPSDEPRVRCGVDPLAKLVPAFDVEAAWDAHARSLLAAA